LREAVRSTPEAAFLENLALGIQEAKLAPAISQIDADGERRIVGFLASNGLSRNRNDFVPGWSP
jgi:hypothetical protein